MLPRYTNMQLQYNINVCHIATDMYKNIITI